MSSYFFCAHSYRPIDCVENKEGDTIRIFQCKYCEKNQKDGVSETQVSLVDRSSQLIIKQIYYPERISL